MEELQEIIRLQERIGRVRAKYKNINRLIDLKKYKYAEGEIEKLLRENPHDYQALLLRGICFEKEGKIDSAIMIYETLIKEDPVDSRGHFLLGSLLVDGINKKRGIKELKKGIELNPN